MPSIRDAYDVIYCAPPAKETPPAVREWRERQQIFHGEAAERGRHVGYQATAADNTNICVLDEHSNHKRVSKNCPHGLLTADFDTITVITF